MLPWSHLPVLTSFKRMVYRFFESLIDPFKERCIGTAASVHVNTGSTRVAHSTDLARPPADTAAFFSHYLRPVAPVLLATLLLAGIAALSELYIYIYLGRIVDWMASTERTRFLADHGRSLIWMAIVVIIIRPIALLGSRALINLAIAPGLSNSIRWQNHRYVLRQSIGFFQNDFAGRVAQKVWQTGHAVREAVVNVIDGAWLLLIYLVGTILLLADMNTLLLWPILLWSVAYALVILFMVPPVRRKSARLAEENSGVMGRIVDSYTNIQSVKLFAHHSMEEDYAGEGIRRQLLAFRALMRAILSMTVTMTLLNTVLIASVAIASIMLWLNELISVGEIAVANGLVIRLNQMSGWVLRTITSLFENVGSVQNGIQTISQPVQVVDLPKAPALQVSRGHVKFSGVHFGYTGSVQTSSDHAEKMSGLPESVSRGVVHGLDFEILPGQKVGLVGRSGAGKSTIVNLLMRFHDIDRGRISIDDQPINEVSQDSLRRSIAVVTQDTSLLHRSIRDNIRYGKADADDAAIIRAAEQAEAMEFIPFLSDPKGRRGLDAHVGERGVKLSGGQRQRIAIARVILKNAPILILDEATSALDSEVEAAIQRQFISLMEGKTVLAVAHRLSTIAALDRLIVLDQGRIVESGTHDELKRQRGLYAHLWERQSGGFLGDLPAL